MNKKRVIQTIFLVFLMIGTIFIIRRHQENTLRHSEGNIFGTVYSIDYEYTAQLDSQILQKLIEVDKTLSMFNKSSLVSIINSGQKKRTTKMFRDVFYLADSVSIETNGAYDITVAPLVNAWGFGFKNGIDVSQEDIDSIKQFIGYKKISIKNDFVEKADIRTMLDFSSIAKGYALDCVAKLFDSLKIKNYLIMIGGEVIAHGVHPESRPWKIGISKPTDKPNAENQTILTITNTAMATSGNYLRYYKKNGRRYAHTIDPHSGYPVQHDLLSATVFAPTCAKADAYATAFMVLGMKEAQNILKKHPELSAYFIFTTNDGKYATWMSEDIKKYVIK